MKYILAYLAAIIAANVSIGIFGPVSAPVNGFFLIGAVLVLRDTLHDRYGPLLIYLLIPIGAGLSFLFGPEIARISVGGALAFVLSEIVDTAVYARLWHRDWGYRVNVSNLFGAAVDSCVFFPVAFGTFPVWLVIIQFFTKTIGGAIWAGIIKPYRT